MSITATRIYNAAWSYAWLQESDSADADRFANWALCRYEIMPVRMETAYATWLELGKP